MKDYGDKQKERRKAGQGSKLHKCSCGHRVYLFEAFCPICEAENPLYGAETPAAPSRPITRE